MLSVFGRRRPWSRLGPLLALVALMGCGDLYRPIVTSIPPVEPAPQPTKYAVVISCGSTPNTTASRVDLLCAGSTVPGKSSLVDFSGDSLMASVFVGNGPRWLALDARGVTAYLTNADGTVNTFIAESSPSNPLESNNVNTSTLLSDAQPNTLLVTNKYLYVSQPGRSSIGVLTGLTGAAPSLFLEIPISDPAHPGVSQNPVNLVGNSNTQRVYAISQGANAAGCPASGSAGTATGIEIATNTISSVLPLGDCPVYGVMTSDNRRAFILNEASGTVTVIDSQQNRIDPNPNLNNGTIAVGQGPIWADIYNGGSILAVANSQSNTLSLINITLDAYGNDGPNFGQIIATVPVGPNPSSVAILQDGTRAYVANRNDPTNQTDITGNGSVSVVSLLTNTVLKTIPLPQEPCVGNPTVECNVHPMSIAATTGTPLGKVYVVSPETNVMTILRTDNDTIYENLPLTGNGVQVRVTAP